MEQLGLTLYNFHAGSNVGQVETDKSLQQVADALNEAHSQTNSIITVIENTAGSGHTLGCTFEEMRKIIDKVKDKSRMGVTLDTNHLFAAGYDIRTRESCEKVFKEFNEKIGFDLLRGVHLNDSKRELNSRVDRHENIGKGSIGLECFKTILNDERFANLPLILETEGPYDEEIKLLNSLID
jgi:apurinic endonuclease APN1